MLTDRRKRVTIDAVTTATTTKTITCPTCGTKEQTLVSEGEPKRFKAGTDAWTLRMECKNGCQAPPSSLEPFFWG